MSSATPRDAAEIWASLSDVDGKFFHAVHELLNLYDLMDVDRDLIEEEMALVESRWVDVVGDDLATLDDRQAIADGLCEIFASDSYKEDR